MYFTRKTTSLINTSFENKKNKTFFLTYLHVVLNLNNFLLWNTQKRWKQLSKYLILCSTEEKKSHTGLEQYEGEKCTFLSELYLKLF